MRLRNTLAVILTSGLCWLGAANDSLQAGLQSGGADSESAQELTPAQRLQRINSEFESELDKLQEEYRQAETDAGRSEVQIRYQELQRAKVSEAVKLAAANRETQLVGETFSWLLRAMVEQQARQAVKAACLEGHLDNGSLAPTMVIAGMADEREFLRSVIKRATNKTLVAAACFNLAMSLRRSETITAAETAEAISLLERVIDEFANQLFVLPEGPPGGRLGDLAAPPLFEFKYLSVGKVAPEIDGEDIAGAKFRLSDYRGQIVLLSFWGDW